MTINETGRRRSVRNIARAVTAFCAAMLAITVWVTTDQQISTAEAAIDSGPIQVITPLDGSPSEGQQLDSGDETTAFTLRLPAGAACTGDSANDGYRVIGYLVPAGTDISTVTFGLNGPEPSATGAPQSAFRQPLYETTGSPFYANTANAQPGSAAGFIINIPNLSLGIYEDPGTPGAEVPSGDYELGVVCWGPNTAANPTPAVDQFWRIPVSITEVAGPPTGLTWELTQATVTTTSLAVTPAATADAGDEVTLTATVNPPEATGSVEFFADGVSLAPPTGVAAGTAELVTSDLPTGTINLTATFTPDSGTYTPSTSEPLVYDVVSDEIETTVTITADPIDEAEEGEPVSLTATITPPEAIGTVEFSDGELPVGPGAVTVADGMASLSVDDLALGEHVLMASFVPDEDSGFAEAASEPLPYSIVEAGPDATTVALSVSPTGGAPEGTDVTFRAVIDPLEAVGTVTFAVDGDDVGAAVTVADGVASVTTAELAIGEHSVIASFVPDDDEAFDAADSDEVTYEIREANESTTTTTEPTTTDSTTTSAPTDTTVPTDLGVDISPGTVGVLGGSGGPTTGSSGGLGSLPVTGGSGAVALWGALLLVSGRVAVLLGRTPRPLPAGRG